MQTKRIKVQPLTSRVFVRYGEVISTEGEPIAMNDGNSKKWNNLAHFDMFDDRGVANLGILRTAPIMTEFSKMERHHFTSQIFIPLNGKRSLVAVAPPSDVAPALDEVKIFLMEGNQGVNLFRKTWHHTLFPLDGETDYVLIQRGGDVGDDVEFAAFEQGARVTVD